VNDKYIAQAPTQKEATIKGLNALGITQDEAIITVEEQGKKGFLGIGQKDAVVVVERKEKLNVVDEFLSNELEDMDTKQSSKRSNATKEVASASSQNEEAAYASESETNSLGNDPEEEKAKEEEANMSAEEMTVGRNQADVERVGDEEQKQSQSQNQKENKKENKKEEPKESAEPTEAEIYEKDQEAIEDVRQYLNDIIVAMGVDDVEVFTSRVKFNVKYDIETDNAGLVIGRHGKVLNGLQTLAQNHMHQLAYSKVNVRVDAEKYRERRKNTVENLARRTADKVLKTDKAVKLDPMPAHERKQIHRYLNKNSKVKTHSEGREPKRFLVIEPEN